MDQIWARTLTKYPTSPVSPHRAKIRFVNLRLQQFYGPRDHISKFPSLVIRACCQNQDELDLTAGTQFRDFIYIDDLVSAIDTIVANIETLGRFVEVDVGSEESVTVKEFVNAAHSISNSSTKLRFGAIPIRASSRVCC